jgi:hypothetical protein
VLNGPQLATLLPSRSELPSGWTWGPAGTSAEFNSGRTLNAPPYLQILRRGSCRKYEGVDAQYLISDDSAAYATLQTSVAVYKNVGQGAVDVASYKPGWAAKQFSLIKQFASQHCGPFSLHDPITRALVKMAPTIRSVSGVGDEAILFHIRQTNGPLPNVAADPKNSYYPGDYLLVAQVGNYIADADAPAIPQTPEVQQVTSIVTRLVGKLRAIR